MADQSPDAPKTIGPYRLHELLGEGGMGSVYRAVQLRPVQREVALKVVKLGMDTKEVVARFESERQALAVMDHFNIAKVLDAGASDSGRPYFVMELVRGVPMDEYCDTHKLGTRDRLEIFIQVCDAVQHAHQKGVIHRDLKPSNVLVAVQDQRPVPKVIDFGIAKAIGSTLTDHTLVTALGQALGTPAFMSPEQAERSGLDVDTRTDVYSLGVMLYQLLSGALPFDRDALLKPDFVVQHLLRERDVPTPSARLSALADTQETVARNRHTDVRTLRRELTGDLDWIVMRAMAKDRTRRYGTASDLAEDLRRFLNGDPVSARPPSTAYRAMKFARRHRGSMAAGVALLLSLAGGAAVSTAGFVKAARNAALASDEAARAEAVRAFLDRMLRAGDPVRGSGPNTTVREVLDAASAEVEDGAFLNRPLVEISVRRSIGGTYMLMGLYEEAGKHLDAARLLLQRTPDASPMETVHLLDELGQLRRRQGELKASEALYQEALAVADAAGFTHDAGEGEELVNDVRNDLGLVLRSMDRIDEAAEILEDLAASQRALLAGDDLDLATTLNNLALVKRAQGDIDSAIRLFRETLEVLRGAVGESHIYVAAVLESIGSLEQRRGHLEAAEDLMQESLAMRREVAGPRHPDVVNGLNGLGLLYVEMDRLDDAERTLEEALQLSTEVLGPEHDETGSVLNSLGLLHLRRQDPAAAEAAFRRSVAIREASLGARHRNTLNTNANLAAALVLGDKAADAEALARYVVGLEEAIGLDDAVFVGSARRTWGQALTALGRYPEAEEQLLAAYEIQDEELGPGQMHTQSTVRALVKLYEAWNRAGEAATWKALDVSGTT